jgi:hypothetical protein
MEDILKQLRQLGELIKVANSVHPTFRDENNSDWRYIEERAQKIGSLAMALRCTDETLATVPLPCPAHFIPGKEVARLAQCLRERGVICQ